MEEKKRRIHHLSNIPLLDAMYFFLDFLFFYFILNARANSGVCNLFSGFHFAFGVEHNHT